MSCMSTSRQAFADQVAKHVAFLILAGAFLIIVSHPSIHVGLSDVSEATNRDKPILASALRSGPIPECLKSIVAD